MDEVLPGYLGREDNQEHDPSLFGIFWLALNIGLVRSKLLACKLTILVVTIYFMGL